MVMMTKERCLGALVRTPVILQGILSDVSANGARLARDGADGWSVVEILCHLRDFDGFYRLRCEMMLELDHPNLPAYDHVALARDNDYQGQEVQTVLGEYVQSRRLLVGLVSGLDRVELERTGNHPESGHMTVLEQAFRAVTHDIDHIEQIVRALERAERFDSF